MSLHDNAQLLIPWYVNGTLNETDMASVDQHLTDCQHCRTRVDDEVRIARSMHVVDDVRLARLIDSGDRHFGQLRSRLTDPGIGIGDRVKQIDRRPRRLVPVFATALIAMIVIPVAIFRPATEPVLFEVRTSSPDTAGPVLQLVFEPGTTAEDVTLLLDASGAVIGSPSRYGVYRIALSTDNPQALLERIRRHPAVRWAEIEL